MSDLRKIINLLPKEDEEIMDNDITPLKPDDKRLDFDDDERI
jgi:hypothetical protein